MAIHYFGGVKRYYVYITTNQHRTVLYTGVTGFLQRRMDQHCMMPCLKENTSQVRIKVST